MKEKRKYEKPESLIQRLYGDGLLEGPGGIKFASGEEHAGFGAKRQDLTEDEDELEEPEKTLKDYLNFKPWDDGDKAIE